MGKHRQELILSAVGFPEHFFSRPLLGYVRVGGEQALVMSVLIADGNGAREDPAILSDLAAQWEGIFPDLDGLARACNARHDAVHMVGVVALSPSPVAHLLEGQ